MLSLLGTLLIGSVVGLVSAFFSSLGLEIVGLVGFTLLLFVPTSLTYLIHCRVIRWFYSIKPPNWLPGTKYLIWRKQSRQSIQNWDKRHGRREALDSFVVLFWSTLLTGWYIFQASNSALIALPREEFFLSLFSFWLTAILLLYGLDTYFRWRRFHKQWLKSPSSQLPNPQLKPANVDDELSRLKQKIQTTDGYIVQPNRIDPEVAKATLNQQKADKVRFKGQIVQDVHGTKGEILEIVEKGSKIHPKECLMGTLKAQRCTLIILWDKETTHEHLPANTTLISSVVDTHNPLYPVLNYLEWSKFRSSQE